MSIFEEAEIEQLKLEGEIKTTTILIKIFISYQVMSILLECFVLILWDKFALFVCTNAALASFPLRHS